MNDQKYCESLTQYKRWQTREVKVGDVVIGGSQPIRLQSMNNVDPMDVNANVEQALRIADKGGEIVRITAPATKEAANLALIREELDHRNCKVPLVADIHFNPRAAYEAAKHVEKVRINPGNFAELYKNETELSDEQYQEALSHIETKLIPLLDICKERKIAIRIGSNHGSLAQRILNKHGDTPEGMVEAAMEYLRICRNLGFLDIVLSMKASNIRVMVQAYRLLVHKMMKEDMNFPIHLGVTEAGEGEDGRVKSAAGIGCMLEDGIGDTIRVSLTEDPEFEIPVAEMIAERYINRNDETEIPAIETNPLNPFEFQKRVTHQVGRFGGDQEPQVVGLDILFDDKHPHKDRIVAFKVWNPDIDNTFPLLNVEEFEGQEFADEQVVFLELNVHDLVNSKTVELIKSRLNTVIVLTATGANSLAQQRRAFIELLNLNLTHPVIIKREYNGLDADRVLLYASADFGALFIDGLGDGMWIESSDLAWSQKTSWSLSILQAARARITRTEYISCPSCGRTLFNIQEATQKVRARTEHLKGLKIAVMGCIVNGPGEMADADYGYVGAGPNKINLYKKKEVVAKGLEEDIAVDALIDLIKTHGDWVDA
jgi:(E)-4-hydroxy-3-methylbut-2-enyl-diphosphate synthase